MRKGRVAGYGDEKLIFLEEGERVENIFWQDGNKFAGSKCDVILMMYFVKVKAIYTHTHTK